MEISEGMQIIKQGFVVVVVVLTLLFLVFVACGSCYRWQFVGKDGKYVYA